MARWNDRRIAALALAAAILFGALYGSYRSLNALRGDAAILYQTEWDGRGIANDLDDLVTEAGNMARLLDDGETVRLLVLRDQLKGASGPAAAHSAATELLEEMRRLDEEGDLSDLKPAQVTAYHKIYGRLKDLPFKWNHSAYNASAASFNQTLSTFPASVLSRLTGVKPLEEFR